MDINSGRWTADIDGDFVVFLIGADLRDMEHASPAGDLLASMIDMLVELEQDPATGLLGYQAFGDFGGVIVQYWRSFDALETYAKDPGAKHAPVWRAWNRLTEGELSVAGIWHETFQVSAGQYEAMYQNMPTTGLQRAGTPMTVTEATASARQRLGKGKPASDSVQDGARQAAESAGAAFDGVNLTGARFRKTHLNDAMFRMVDLSGVVMRDVSLSGAAIDGAEIDGLLINGVEVAPLIEAELTRREPARALRRAPDPTGLQAAWAALEASWAATYERVALMPAGTAEISVAGEWSFADTLRHLVFVTDAWFGAIVGSEDPFHPWAMPFTDFPEWVDPEVDTGIDPNAAPSYAEVCELRADRVAKVRDFLSEVTPERLAEERNGPLWDRDDVSAVRCLWVILAEECEHHRFAQRDLDLIDAGSPLAATTPSAVGQPGPPRGRSDGPISGGAGNRN